jgi:uncharacterized protein YqeY
MKDNPACQMRARLRGDLTAALKRGERREARVLRALIAAIDNAEAAPSREESVSLSRHDFGAGTAEAPRRHLSQADIDALLACEIGEREAASATYAASAHFERASGLNAEAELIARYREALAHNGRPPSGLDGRRPRGRLEEVADAGQLSGNAHSPLRTLDRSLLGDAAASGRLAYPAEVRPAFVTTRAQLRDEPADQLEDIQHARS